MILKGFIFRSLGRIRYCTSAKTRYHIHSPFVFELIEKVINRRVPAAQCTDIRRIKSILLANQNSVEITDFGSHSGRQRYQHRFELVSHIARTSAISRKDGELLYRLVGHFKPLTIIEMGTSLGISTMYMAKAAPNAKLITIEGCSTKAGIAVNSFKKLELENIQQQIGHFDLILPDILAENSDPDFIFIDGNHTQKATMRYFQMLIQNAHNDTVFVFHDIHYSRGMETAWQKICSDPRVTVSLDLYALGIIFLKKELSKQHFVIRF